MRKIVTEFIRLSAFFIAISLGLVANAQTAGLSAEEKSYRAKVKSHQNYGDSAAAVAVAKEYSNTISQKYGPQSREMSRALHTLGHAYFTDGRYEQAAFTLRQALLINEQQLGKDHVDLLPDLELLATVYYAMLQFPDADRIKERVSKIKGN